MTSANLSDTPVLIDNEEALIKLKDIADSFLLHDRKIENRCDDSLIRIVNDKPYFIRKSRGYAPIVIHTPFDVDGLLALGAHQKGSFALGKNHHVFISPYIGNMETIETMEHLLKLLIPINAFSKLRRVKLAVINILIMHQLYMHKV